MAKKYWIASVAMLITAIQAVAADLDSGSVDSLINECKISVSLDCSKCVYKVNAKRLPFENFLAKARRDDDWEQKSLDYFIENLNDIIFDEGIVAVSSAKDNDLRYELIISPRSVIPNGNLYSLIYVKDNSKDEVIATISFMADGDDDDRIALRDPLKEAEEEVGKLLKKLFKKVRTKKG